MGTPSLLPQFPTPDKQVNTVYHLETPACVA